ncbi:MAG: helix-turn-helix transcriptional regulator [Oscillospiraceae bacterium]|nr:helix-turn-helix transcriptional regulator [Oscillospiraceae bacterium]
MYGKRLRVSRKKMNMTLEQVAKILNTTHASISRYENEKTKIDPDTLITLCKLYNVSANYILGLPKDMPHPDDEE